jgi:hypothetical protein
MDKHLAFAVLNLSPNATFEDIEETVEAQIFELRTYFLRQPIVAALYVRRTEKCAQIFDLAQLFDLTLSDNGTHIHIPLAEGTLEEILKNYEAITTQLRSQMARTMHPESIRLLALNLVSVQQDFEKHFLAITNGEAATPVLAADQLQTGRLLRLLTTDANQPEVLEIIARERSRILALTHRPQQK